MNLKFYFIIIVLAFTYSQSIVSQNIYERLYPDKCDSLIKVHSENPNFVILDVRTGSEWMTEHLEGSINRSTGDSDFQQRLALLPKHKIFLLHCQSGGRSAGAFAKMQDLEFTEVYEMIGGLNGWKNYNLPTTSETAPRLMLVSHEGIDGDFEDTIKITVTNRANDQLRFQSVTIIDDHDIIHNFDQEIVIEGAEDYTFSIYHSPDYVAEDSTQIWLESNGGQLNLNLMVENEFTTEIQEPAVQEFSIFPNPARNRIFVKGISGNIDEIRTYNLLGQQLIHKTNFTKGTALNVSNLKEGIHMVQIKTGNKIISQKLLIKH
ncbi:T9SS type A sorting domain-containing protein [Prolixibacteraceae bacterium Z1-6]|uniref:T9SS type A sorting domain-containing protein n=1 Tax=Draconibacterium aestuarii TaxID=2998507 RepID=A0A9X3F7Y3_9BACT|nr:T9SS type A sorting domain-containing protein [Prolixibacteraceae bacterium Z1-6]